MAPVNLFSFMQQRQYGGPRPRVREVQLTLLRMRTRWSLSHALPRGSRSVKDIVLLSSDAFCLLHKGGRADAFMVTHRDDPPQLVWLTSLSLFEGERVRLLTHIRASNSLLTVFALAGREHQGTLHVRVFDVSAVLRGVPQTRNCGTLSELAVPTGGFVEYDEHNQCVWVNDGPTLGCWDAGTFEQRFVLGPWGPENVPNVRFTHGRAALLRPHPAGVIEVGLHSAWTGERLALREFSPKPHNASIVFLELINDHIMLKRAGCDVEVASLRDGAEPCSAPGTKDWEPELFVFMPLQHLILARFAETIEIWRCLSPETFRRVSTVSPVADFDVHRYSVDERFAVALVVRPRAILPTASEAKWLAMQAERGALGAASRSGEDLTLLNLRHFGDVCAAIRGACGGPRGGGVAHVIFDAAQGVLLLMSRGGDLSVHHALGHGGGEWAGH